VLQFKSEFAPKKLLSYVKYLCNNTDRFNSIDSFLTEAIKSVNVLKPEICDELAKNLLDIGNDDYLESTINNSKAILSDQGNEILSLVERLLKKESLIPE
jgi:hypothetical protein